MEMLLKKLIKSDGDARYDVSFRRRNSDTSLRTVLCSVNNVPSWKVYLQTTLQTRLYSAKFMKFKLIK